MVLNHVTHSCSCSCSYLDLLPKMNLSHWNEKEMEVTEFSKELIFYNMIDSTIWYDWYNSYHEQIQAIIMWIISHNRGPVIIRLMPVARDECPWWLPMISDPSASDGCMWWVILRNSRLTWLGYQNSQSIRVVTGACNWLIIAASTLHYFILHYITLHYKIYLW